MLCKEARLAGSSKQDFKAVNRWKAGRGDSWVISMTHQTTVSRKQHQASRRHHRLETIQSRRLLTSLS